MPEYYIYYRARAADEARVLALVHDWQQALRARQAGCSARLLKRPAETLANEHQTWMETYRFDAEQGGQLAPAIEPVELAEGPPALAALLIGQRHVEIFEPCAS